MSDLQEAFTELERRADIACDRVGALEVIGASGVDRPLRGRPAHPVRSGHRARPARLGTSVAAVAASAAAVAAVAVGITVAAGHGTSQVTSGAPDGVVGAGNPSTHASTAPVPTGTTPPIATMPKNPVMPKTAPKAPPKTAPSKTDVPKNEDALIARFRSILGGTATFTVDSALSYDHLITGVLTSASGTRGMYVLEVDRSVGSCPPEPPGGPSCAPPPPPPVTTVLPDGSKLEVDANFPDGPPDGVMNDAVLNRPDGWQISLYTTNVQAKRAGAPVLGNEPALTVKEVTDIVTSPKWLVK